MVSPLPPAPLAPLSSMIGGHAAPGAHGLIPPPPFRNALCVVPSRVTGVVMFGSAVAGVIVKAPFGPIKERGMLNWIVLVDPAFAFESSIAWRSEPGPLSFVLTTVNVTGPVATVV